MMHIRKLFLPLLALFITVIALTPLNAQKEKQSNIMGQNNIGKEFYFTIPPAHNGETSGTQGVVHIYVTSSFKTEVRVDIPSKQFSEVKMTSPNDIIEFNLEPEKAQPYLKAGFQEEVPEKVWKQSAIHVKADDPVVVYVVCRYRYTSDGFVAIPVSGLGTEYICASYADMTNMFPDFNFPSLCGVTAAFDNTTVKFTVGGTSLTKTAGGLKSGESVTYTMNKGDVVMFSSDGGEQDLSGSRILSDKPVSVVSGNQCANIPTDNQWCDYIVEMDMPTHIWDKDYFVPTIHNRKRSSIVRVFAKEDNTNIYRDGIQFATLTKGRGGIKEVNFIEARLADTARRSAVISGDKPINVVLYNPGSKEDGYPNPNTDPFQMQITPISQYQDYISFCTPGYQGDGYEENYVNLVYETDDQGLVPDDMQFWYRKDGIEKWETLRTKYPDKDEMFQYQPVAGKKYARKLLILPRSAAFKIKGSKPFAAYSYGFTPFDSYGYPTGAAVEDREKMDEDTPDPDWDIDVFGNVANATVSDPGQEDTRSNLAYIYMNPDTSKNYTFTNVEFIPGRDASATWNLNVADKRKPANAEIVFSDRAGNDTSVFVNYKPPVHPEKEKVDFYFNASGWVIEKVKIINTSNETIKFKPVVFAAGDKGFSIVKSFEEIKANSEEFLELKFTENGGKGIYKDIALIQPDGFDRPYEIELQAEVIVSADEKDETYYLEVSPNPVTDKITVRMHLKDAQHVAVKLYRSDGKLVEVIQEAFLKAGDNIIAMDNLNLPSGSYYIEAVSKEKRAVSKLNIVK